MTEQSKIASMTDPYAWTGEAASVTEFIERLQRFTGVRIFSHTFNNISGALKIDTVTGSAIAQPGELFWLETQEFIRTGDRNAYDINAAELRDVLASTAAVSREDPASAG